MIFKHYSTRPGIELAPVITSLCKIYCIFKYSSLCLILLVTIAFWTSHLVARCACLLAPLTPLTFPQRYALICSLCLLAPFTASLTHFGHSLIGQLKFLNLCSHWNRVLRKEVCLISSLETPFVCASRGGRGASTRWNHHLSVHHVVEFVFSRIIFCRPLEFGVWSISPHDPQR